MRARETDRTCSGPWACCPSSVRQRPEGPVFRRGAVSRLPGTVFRSHPAARHRTRTVPRVSTSPNSTRFTTTSTTPNSPSAISSSTTACTSARDARSRRCSKAPSTRPCETRLPSGSRASTFQKGQLDDALQALGRIEGTVPGTIRDDVEFLRANVYMATGRPGEAVKVLAQLQERCRPRRVCGLQPRHRAVAGRSTTRKRSSN